VRHNIPPSFHYLQASTGDGGYPGDVADLVVEDWTGQPMTGGLGT